MNGIQVPLITDILYPFSIKKIKSLVKNDSSPKYAGAKNTLSINRIIKYVIAIKRETLITLVLTQLLENKSFNFLSK